MTFRAIGLNRRLFLAASASVAMWPSAALAKEKEPTGIRLQFTYKGHPFGVVITKATQGALVTLRSLKTKFRTSSIVMPNKAVARKKSVEINVADVSAKVGLDRRGGLLLSGEGIKLTKVEPHPAPEGPQPQGWFGNLMSSIGGALEGIGAAIGAGISWLLGAEFTYSGSWFFIWVKDGTIMGSMKPGEIGGGGNGFMPPPPGTEEDPTVWY